MKYINRILVPLKEGSVDLTRYFRVGPQLPEEPRLTFTGFINQHSAVEVGTGNTANVILASQPSERDSLPTIFDIEAMAKGTAEPDDWERVASSIQSLRTLKNQVFLNTLTAECLNLFQ